MLCPKCGKEFTTKFCPNCGYTAPVGTTPDIQSGSDKKSGCLIAVLVAVGVVIFFLLVGSFAGSTFDTISSSVPASASDTDSASSEVKPVGIHFEAELTDGHYTVGVDFPAGVYDIIAVSGSGKVSSDNSLAGGINAMIGITEDNFSHNSSPSSPDYRNVKLPQKTVLSVSNGVTIKILSEDASDKPLVPRSQTITETVELTGGSFTAGKDFPAGVYDLTALTGFGIGNVSSSNLMSGGINAIMGVTTDGVLAGSCQSSYKNIVLSDGVKLKLNGVKLSLSPSK